MIKVIHNDCLNELKRMDDNLIDSVVTDPPYGLSFMNKHWDYDVPGVEIWEEVLRVLKPGGHLLSFGGTRTYHRMVCAIEDAGFEIRDQLQWIYGSGFPKSLNIGNGFGTALKPANEPICLARKPLSEKTVAENVLKWGTGGINIDGCRIESEVIKTGNGKVSTDEIYGKYAERNSVWENSQGRFPANVILDEEASKAMDLQAPKTGAFAPVKSGHNGESKGIYGDFMQKGDDGRSFHDGALTGASRFFYCAKASKSERNKGLEEFELKPPAYGKNMSSSEKGSISGSKFPSQNNHPTVKPISLMRYLCKLITPPMGVVLDPFAGSCTTGIGAKLEGFDFVGIEREEEYCEIGKARIEAWESETEDKPDALQQELWK